MLTVEGPGSIPGQGTKILQAMWHGQKTNKQTAKKKKVQNKYEGQRPKEISLRTIPQFRFTGIDVLNATQFSVLNFVRIQKT